MRPLQAWVEGMYELWPNATAEEPIQVDYEPYAAPLPTITIGNIVPELSPAVGPASISIQCVAVFWCFYTVMAWSVPSNVCPHSSAHCLAPLSTL